MARDFMDGILASSSFIKKKKKKKKMRKPFHTADLVCAHLEVWVDTIVSSLEKKMNVVSPN